MFGLFKKSSDDVGAEVFNSRGTLCVEGMELGCTLRQGSDSQMRLTLNKPAGINGRGVLVDHKRGLAFECSIAQVKGNEVTLRLGTKHNLAGLVPARIGRARDIWKRS